MGSVKLHTVLRSRTFVTDIVNEVSSCILNCAVILPLLTFLTNSVKLHSVLRSYTSVTDILNEQCQAANCIAQSNIRY